jgi:hypothetical protein
MPVAMQAREIVFFDEQRPCRAERSSNVSFGLNSALLAD